MPRTIMVALTDRPEMTAVLDAALDLLAGDESACLHLIAVRSRPAGGAAHARPALGVDPREFRRRNGRLEELIARARRRHGQVVVRQVIGDPATELVAEAGRIAADLMVMGSTHTTPWQHLLHGSVPAAVMRRWPHPVLLVPIARPTAEAQRLTGEPALAN